MNKRVKILSKTPYLAERHIQIQRIRFELGDFIK